MLFETAIFYFTIFCVAALLASPMIIGIVLLRRNRRRAGSIILGAYLVLVSTFVIYGLAEKRSTPGHIVRWLKGEGLNLQHATDFAEDARKVVNPSELQQWAVTILRETQQTNSDIEIPTDKVPAYIRNLTSDGVPFEDASCEEGFSDRSIWLWWGGPFGHWGLSVGSQTYKFTPTLTYNYFIEWKPGVYFFCETRP
jgi:hypothetical protein